MRTVDVIVTLLAATDKLVLVSLHGDRDNAVWLHRDAISIAGLIESDHNCIITLPAQLARKKKLMSYVSRPRHPNSVYQVTGRARRRMHHDAATTLERWSVRRSFWQYVQPMLRIGAAAMKRPSPARHSALQNPEQYRQSAESSRFSSQCHVLPVSRLDVASRAQIATSPKPTMV